MTYNLRDIIDRRYTQQADCNSAYSTNTNNSYDDIYSDIYDNYILFDDQKLFDRLIKNNNY